MSALDVLSTCLPKVRIPSLGDNVYKEECCISFDTPKSKGGLYICLTTFLSFNEKYVKLYNAVTQNRVFLHIRHTKKVPIETAAQSGSEAPNEKKPKRLAIGVEGGFNPEEDKKIEYDELNTLAILPDFLEIPLDNIEEIPSLVLASVSGVLSSTAVSKKEDILAWDGEIRTVTKHGATLKQLDNGIKIPPGGWKCARCDFVSNLWLNLTDGMILCGRKYFDGTGGNNHAVEYFKETGYPLAVKLGTITASGADVFSYGEDQMVEDPELAKHLSHFGINMMNMTKTEQTMTELEIELNEKIGSEWNIIQEAGKNLKELSGPGLTGLKNMGNTCYLNSIAQVLLSITEFQQRYTNSEKCLDVFKKHLSSLSWDQSSLGQFANNPAKLAEEIQKRIDNIMSDFTYQMCRVGFALYNSLSEDDDFSEKDMTETYKSNLAVTPRSFKHLIGKDHPEFSTNRQQDAHEFFIHLLSLLERSEHKSAMESLGNFFKFMVEERTECLQSKQVRYTKRPDYVLQLSIPMHLATNKAEVEAYNVLKEAKAKDSSVVVGEVVRAKVSLLACLEATFQDEIITDFWSSALQEKAEAKKRTRFSTFPDYLVVQMKKFTIGNDWVPKKLDVSVDMPESIDLNEYRGTGLQADETLLPDVDPPTMKEDAPPEMEVDEEAMINLSQMGFPLERCKEAIIATGNTGIENAAMWLMDNNSPEAAAAPVESGPSNGSVEMIMTMGFTREQAMKALRATDNNLERAADWIFSHPNELDTVDVPVTQSNPTAGVSATAGEGDVAMETNQSSPLTDGSGNYELLAFVSHMGTSTMCGHYVCHIKKDGRWVIFNDEKVAASEQPPKDLGYIYFYRRVRE
ncbi:unnamed protein product [Clavelina lepadiformis]|uniref:Ubiquitin carboxyl-terminal hydrolase n=1 Tax=Clavelina lepadiformis TaxID=159417 RepID=A0ABP0FXH4_CLALP